MLIFQKGGGAIQKLRLQKFFLGFMKANSPGFTNGVILHRCHEGQLVIYYKRSCPSDNLRQMFYHF
ncbi:MAG: hypothetical protein K0Q87_1904 [Neobacillus sp.]|nr:hypothetical protein [Neobacillus sp.]